MNHHFASTQLGFLDGIGCSSFAVRRPGGGLRARGASGVVRKQGELVRYRPGCVRMTSVLPDTSNVVPPKLMGFLEAMSTLAQSEGRVDLACKKVEESYGSVFQADLLMVKPVIVSDPEYIVSLLREPEKNVTFGPQIDIVTRLQHDSKEMRDVPAFEDNFFAKYIAQGFTKGQFMQQYINLVQENLIKEIAIMAAPLEPDTKYSFRIDSFVALSRVAVKSAVASMLGPEVARRRGEEIWKYHYKWEMNATNPFFLFAQHLPVLQLLVNRVRGTYRKIVDIFMEELNIRLEDTETEHKDYLAFLIKQAGRDRLLSDPLLRLECARHLVSIIFAQHVTTVSSTLMTLSRMTSNQEWLLKVREEAEGIDLKDTAFIRGGGAPFLEALWNEALRMTNFSGVIRAVSKPGGITLGNLNLAKDTVLLLNAPMLHQNPEFYENPEEIRPERWFEEGNDEESRVKRGEYFKFGVGAHKCAGRKFAEMMVKTINLHIAETYDVSLENDRESLDVLESKFGFFLPKEPVRLDMKPRQV